MGSDHLGAGLEYVRSKEVGCADHWLTIDLEVTDVPGSSRCTEGTTLVTELVYVAVGVSKSGAEPGRGVATAANSLGCGDKDAEMVVKRPGPSGNDRRRWRNRVK